MRRKFQTDNAKLGMRYQPASNDVFLTTQGKNLRHGDMNRWQVFSLTNQSDRRKLERIAAIIRNALL